MANLDTAIATVVKTGKVYFGLNQAIKDVKAGKSRLIIFAADIPDWMRKSVQYYAEMAQIPTLNYKGNSVDLGIICGKRFPISTMTIKDQGDSDILLINGSQEKLLETKAGKSGK